MYVIYLRKQVIDIFILPDEALAEAESECNTDHADMTCESKTELIYYIVNGKINIYCHIYATVRKHHCMN